MKDNLVLPGSCQFLVDLLVIFQISNVFCMMTFVFICNNSRNHTLKWEIEKAVHSR